jgi:hypothetical protein
MPDATDPPPQTQAPPPATIHQNAEVTAPLSRIRLFMDFLKAHGRSCGYFPEPSKSIMIVADDNV